MYKLARQAALALRRLYFRLLGRFDCEIPPYGQDVSGFVRRGQLTQYAREGGLSFHVYQGPGSLEQEREPGLNLSAAYAVSQGRLFARFISIKNNQAAGADLSRICAALSAKFGYQPQILPDKEHYLLRLWEMPGASLVFLLKYDSLSSDSLSVCYFEPLNPGLDALKLLESWPRPHM